MRGIINIVIVCLGFWFQRPKPAPKPVAFKWHQTHLNYIRDSIQPPIPQVPITIIINEYLRWDKIAGSTHQITDNVYLIQLNQLHKRDQWSTVIHELVHVKQMVKRHLVRAQLQWYWHQKPIDWRLPYKQRPWELEAERESLLIQTRTQPNQ